MSPEPDNSGVKVVHPALEKMKDLFFWHPSEGSSINSLGVHRLNDNELFEAFRGSDRQVIRCIARRNSDVVVEFWVGENGLEHIGFDSLEFSFRGSPRILVKGGIGIGYRGAITSHLYVEEADWKKYQDLANTCAEWVEDSILKGELGPIPLSLFREPRIDRE